MSSYKNKKNTVIYTAIFGKYDIIREPLFPEELLTEVDLICFTDNKLLKSKNFKIIRVKRQFEDPTLENRFYKLQPHKVLNKQYDYNIYVDAHYLITTKRVKHLLSEHLSNDTLLAILKHPERNCIYEEFKACLFYNMDKPEKFIAQEKFYREEGFPEKYGLNLGGLQFRKSDRRLDELLDFWWNEVITRSRRDQLSFNYSIWKLNFQNFKTLDWIPEKNPFGELKKHEPFIKQYGPFKRNFHKIRRKIFGYSKRHIK
ncbi:DUF616 domain-containing protein [Echinicola marina]|uniref:glycosyltransferase domain-containing protein n=1 Tax=Echinicola marina TaxID=2859768 RepID=UPI001CF6169C|nr:glycosyltransferase domain-containing protein [Echinicola marina]UCS91818.1 DUF616 domain-containing protein [Echinicola marina]